MIRTLALINTLVRNIDKSYDGSWTAIAANGDTLLSYRYPPGPHDGICGKQQADAVGRVLQQRIDAAGIEATVRRTSAQPNYNKRVTGGEYVRVRVRPQSVLY